MKENIMNRTIIFEGISNARDLGGLKTKDGRTIRSHALIRSAKLSSANHRDEQKLRDEYRLKKIIDLRTPVERMEKPDAYIDGAENLSIPVFKSAIEGISHEEETKMLQEAGGLAPFYYLMVTDENCRRNFNTILTTIFSFPYEQGSLLWHCTEGKDRCGLVSAFVLLALGVDLDEVKRDYDLTNLVNEKKAMKYYEQALRNGDPQSQAEYVRDMFLAKPEYLETAIDAIKKNYNDFDTYFEKGLNIDRKLIERFKNSILLDD
ncbi:MAG: tyrosine-protein phosphatase [Erysipelotrichaceae bacterium]|nr:tyrosine-protein phosphatase [Erysipelotrichaceae bacterium]